VLYTIELMSGRACVRVRDIPSLTAVPDTINKGKRDGPTAQTTPSGVRGDSLYDNACCTAVFNVPLRALDERAM
jgi:hypothetical protein